jgi:hypothetical protein
MLPLSGDEQPVPILQTEFMEALGVFSPNGRWLAYTSDDSGRFEIYVVPYPGPGGKWQVSKEGGAFWHHWTADGTELLYTASSGALMAVPVNTDSTVFEVGTPRKLFDIDPGALITSTSDGQRVIVALGPETDAVEPISLIVNWTASLNRQ